MDVSVSARVSGSVSNGAAHVDAYSRASVKVECADGGTPTLLGSPTGQDGRLDLSVDGEAASTHAPLRRELEALAK